MEATKKRIIAAVGGVSAGGAWLMLDRMLPELPVWADTGLFFFFAIIALLCLRLASASQTQGTKSMWFNFFIGVIAFGAILVLVGSVGALLSSAHQPEDSEIVPDTVELFPRLTETQLNDWRAEKEYRTWDAAFLWYGYVPRDMPIGDLGADMEMPDARIRKLRGKLNEAIKLDEFPNSPPVTNMSNDKPNYHPIIRNDLQQWARDKEIPLPPFLQDGE